MRDKIILLLIGFALAAAWWFMTRPRAPRDSAGQIIPLPDSLPTLSEPVVGFDGGMVPAPTYVRPQIVGARLVRDAGIRIA